MKILKIVLLLQTIILFISCENKKIIEYKKPIFKEQTVGKVKYISEDIVLKSIFGIEVLDNKIIVIGLINDKFINIFDKNDGKLLNSFISLGRSNEELTFIDSYYLNREDKLLTIFCQTTRRLITLNLNDDMLGQISVEKISKKIPEFTSSALLINDKVLCFSDMFGNIENVNRFSLIDNDNKVIYNNYDPIEDKELRAKAYSQVAFKISPDKSKFAVGTIFGAILESYSIGQNKIENGNISYFIELKKDVGLENVLFGFSDIAVSDEFIYAGYCGTNDLSEFNKLAIFDWKCNPLKLVDFNELNIARLCFDGKNEIYAIVADKDSYIHLAKLSI